MTITDAQRQDTGEIEPARSLLVAIAASAEDLPALSALLATLSSEPRLTIIIAQRASANNGELRTEELASLTKFTVAPMVDGGPVLPGHLYVTPPHTVVKVRKGGFRLRAPHDAAERRAPVDAAFRSLARNFGPRVIGILLRAEGSDGSHRARGDRRRRRNDHGCRRRSRTPTGRFPTALPDSASSMTCFPWTTSPMRCSTICDSGPRPEQAGGRGSGGVESRNSCVEICGVLREQTGIDFKHYRTTTLLRRIERRMHVLRLQSVDV